MSTSTARIPMVSKSKWIDGLEPGERLARAARRSLRRRLDAVHRYLRAAATRRIPDSDVIHQLRVSTRRAMGALECYHDLVPRRRAAWVNKQLKRLRKAANDARDVDVLSARLEKMDDVIEASALKLLSERMRRSRRQAQRPVVDVWRRFKRHDFKSAARKLVRRVHWRDGITEEPKFGVAAHDRLKQVVDQFFAQSDLASSGDIAALHQFRIVGKQLRYAIELFATGLHSRVRNELYPLVEDFQERLGRLNDHATAAERLEQWVVEWSDPELETTLVQLIRDERQACEHARSAFVAWWTADRAAEWRNRFGEALAIVSIERVA